MPSQRRATHWEEEEEERPTSRQRTGMGYARTGEVREEDLDSEDAALDSDTLAEEDSRADRRTRSRFMDEEAGEDSGAESVSGAGALGEEPDMTQVTQDDLPMGSAPSPPMPRQQPPPQYHGGSDHDDDDDDFDEDEQAPRSDPRNSSSRIPRKNAVQGLARVTPTVLLSNKDIYAPLFVVSFRMTDSTSLSRDMHELLWALHNVLCCVEKGEPMGHMNRETPQLKVRMRLAHMIKSVIMSKQPDGSNGVTMPEMVTELRIHEARGKLGDVDIVEFYMLVTVRSPALFSLRHAVAHTLQARHRGMDSVDADARRRVWSRLGTRVRSGLGFSLSDDVDGEVFMGGNTDWMTQPNMRNFTALFSPKSAAECVRRDFFSLHPEAADDMQLEGFGLLRRYIAVPDLEANSLAGRAWEQQTEKILEKTYQRGKKDDEADDDTGILDCLPVPGWNISETQDGLPAPLLVMRMRVSSMTEQAPRLAQFVNMVRSFPASVTMAMLQRTIGQSLPDGSLDAAIGNDTISAVEFTDIVHGKTNAASRPMLSNGDAALARNFTTALTDIPAADRFENAQTYVRMSFLLAMTRAQGSDGYVNDRVHAYCCYMQRPTPDGQRHTPSEQACREAFEKCLDRPGAFETQECPVTAALDAVYHTIGECNATSWCLRPDNLHLFNHLLVSDLMMSLNYFGSCIGGACNGIGATVLVRDGGGSYRETCKEGTGASEGTTYQQVQKKANGTGADNTVNTLKMMLSPGTYEKSHALLEEFIVELKRTSEMGLMQDVCNVYEGAGAERELKTMVRDTHMRLYSTEFRAHNESSCLSCMQAITWLVTRNTSAENTNVYKTTRESEKTKARITVEYRQMLMGFMLLCSNYVGNGPIRERFKTLSHVVRNVASCAAAMNDCADDESPGDVHGRAGGAVDYGSVSNDVMMPSRVAMGRPVFWTVMGVAQTAAFMQWTGMLGRLPASPLVEELTQAFDSQLELSGDLLNRDMFSAGERGRCKQVSKARAVAVSLLGTSALAVREAGRQWQGQREAVERVTLGLIGECMSPAAVPWMIADTLDHMMRLDFILAMQLMGALHRVPDNIELDDVIALLRDGDAPAGSALEGWLRGVEFVKDCVADHHAGGLGQLVHGRLLKHEMCTVHIQPDMQHADVDSLVFHRVAVNLSSTFSTRLSKHCQIPIGGAGTDIVRHMLRDCSNQRMSWPPVFGGGDAILANFWLNDPPLHERWRLNPPAMRVVMLEAHKAALLVDMRWMLLVTSVCGPRASQCSRSLMVTEWVRRFYLHCVPRRLTPSDALFTGLPSPIMKGGFQRADLLPGGQRDVIRRPRGSTFVPAPVVTGLAEDMGAAAPRLQLAHALKVAETDLPTDCVSYHLPSAVPVAVRLSPAQLAEARDFLGGDNADWVPEYAVLLYNEANRKFSLNFSGVTINADATQPPHYLDGRLRFDVRPLPHFHRRGLLARAGDGALGFCTGLVHDLPAYSLSTGEQVDLDAIEERLIPVGTELFVAAASLADVQQFIVAQQGRRRAQVEQRQAGALLRCKLTYPDECTRWAIDVPVLVACGRSNSAGIVEHRAFNVQLRGGVFLAVPEDVQKVYDGVIA